MQRENCMSNFSCAQKNSPNHIEQRKKAYNFQKFND